MTKWMPFKPNDKDLERIANDVAAIQEIQRKLMEMHHVLPMPDRAAHQYQIAGGRIGLKIGDKLPAEFRHVGIFEPRSEYIGIGRISGGLGWPHAETYPDILGMMVAVQTRAGDRVDFLGINDPAAPADNHTDFIQMLHALAEISGAELRLAGEPAEQDVGDLIVAEGEFAAALMRRMDFVKGLKLLTHIARQAFRTSCSSTAYQTYWTDIVEIGGTAGKFIFRPTIKEKNVRKPSSGQRRLTDEWRKRQTHGGVEFGLWWLPFRNQKETPTTELTRKWRERDVRRIGTLTFPQLEDPESKDSTHWAALASEMGANPGNWIHDKDNTIREPATEFGVARKIAYRISQQGRSALEPALYKDVFRTGEIGPELMQELVRRRCEKERAGHVSWAPTPPISQRTTASG